MAKKLVISRHDQWIAAYGAVRPEYERLCVKLKPLIEDLLTSSDVSYQIVEARSKTVESFSEKIQRAGKEYTDPLQQITDLAGMRIILYYIDDIDKVVDLIRREFRVDEARSVDKRTALAPDQFGYLSFHLIVQIAGVRAQLVEWRGLEGLVAEIQIRTVLQHNWAAISHALQYKREADVPDPVKRRLTRLSGLLELADEEFKALKDQQLVLRQEIVDQLSGGNWDIPVDTLSIREFLAAPEAEAIEDLASAATKAGLDITSETRETDAGAISGSSQLTEACRITDVPTIRALKDVLDQAMPNITAFFEALRTSVTKDHEGLGTISGSPAHFAATVLIGFHRPLLKPDEIAPQIGWVQNYARRVIQAGRQFSRRGQA